MEQIYQKPSLPIKTKIVAYWMIVIGGLAWVFMFFFLSWWMIILGSFLVFFDFFKLENITLIDFLSLLFYIFPLLFLILIPVGFYILKRKGWAWRIAIIMLSVGALLLILFWITMFGASGLIPLAILFYTIIIVPPLIFLLLDRKNFWKIAT